MNYLNSGFHPSRKNARLVLALFGTLSLVASISHAEEVNLICAGTLYLHRDEGNPLQMSTDSVTIKLDGVKRTIQIAGTVGANASGPMNVEEGQYLAVLPHANEVKGVRYAYIMVYMNRITGETNIGSASNPSGEGSGMTYFIGKCTRSKRLF